MARNFNGSSQYLRRNSAVITGVPCTLSCWFKKTSLTGDGCLLYAENQADHTYIGLFTRSTASNGNKVQGIVSQSGVSSVVWNGSTYAANAWHFAAIRCTSSTSRDIWYDGTKTSDTTSLTMTSVLDEFVVGRWDHSSPALYFDGAIADVAAWGVALSDAELEAMSLGLRTADQIRPASLIAQYSLGGLRPDDDRDQWARTYDLTATGSPGSADHPRLWYPSEPQIMQASAAATTSFRYRDLTLTGAG